MHVRSFPIPHEASVHDLINGAQELKTYEGREAFRRERPGFQGKDMSARLAV